MKRKKTAYDQLIINGFTFILSNIIVVKYLCLISPLFADRGFRVKSDVFKI